MTPRLAALRQPSIARRVVAVLLAAFVGVFVVLVAIDYGRVRQQIGLRRTQLEAVQAVAASLDGLAPDTAAGWVRATEQVFNRMRHSTDELPLGNLLLRLEDRQGHVLYTAPLLGEGPLAIDHEPAGTVMVGGRPYWAATHTTPRWRLVLLEPPLDDPQLLALLGAGTLESMLVALPLIVLPLWLAVRTGLKPLRLFAERIGRRAPDDLSPMPDDLRHAELQPVVTAFNALLARARAGIARERSFVQDAAHELRTPLAVITAEAHNAAAASDDGARRLARLALERAVARASRLVHQLLALARVDGLAWRPVASVDLVECARRVIIDASPAAEARAAEVALLSPPRLEARLDGALFDTILDNLLRNAISHCPAGARIEVALETGTAGLTLAVRDDGPGIAEVDLPDLFERFRRGRHSGTDQSCGTGLGLAIVRQAVLATGGQVTTGPGLDGRGIAFVLHWPATAS